MRTVVIELKSVLGSGYSPSKQVMVDKLHKESATDFDTRTWREHAWTNEAGEVVIPNIAIHRSLIAAAQSSGKKIPGRRGATYTQLIRAGLMVEDAPLGVAKDDLVPVTVSCQANPTRGEKGGRVPRMFPMIAKWDTTVRIHILNDDVPTEIIREFLVEAGRFVGLGRWRPEKGGYNGRFTLVSLQQIELQEAA